MTVPLALYDYTFSNLSWIGPGSASTHNGEPRAGGRRRGRGNRRRLGTRLWRVLWRWSRRCAGGQQAATRAQVQAGRGDQLRAVQASTAVLGSRGACSEHRIGSAARRCSDSSACRPDLVEMRYSRGEIFSHLGKFCLLQHARSRAARLCSGAAGRACRIVRGISFEQT